MSEGIGFMPVIDHPRWKNIKDSNELLQKSAVLFALSLLPAVRRATAAIEQFGYQMRQIKQHEALNYFASMPDRMSFGPWEQKEFNDRIQKVKENAYLQQHAKLSGSRSTSRLRKKRKDMVDHWYLTLLRK